MLNTTFEHERNPVVVEANLTYVAALRLASTGNGLLDGGLRRHAARLLEHAIAAGDAPSARLRVQSLRYAKLRTLHLCASVAALAHEGLLSGEPHREIRRQLARLLDELGCALRGTSPAEVPAPTSRETYSHRPSEPRPSDASEDLQAPTADGDTTQALRAPETNVQSTIEITEPATSTSGCALGSAPDIAAGDSS
jgi:hypothetical protein